MFAIPLFKTRSFKHCNFPLVILAGVNDSMMRSKLSLSQLFDNNSFRTLILEPSSRTPRFSRWQSCALCVNAGSLALPHRSIPRHPSHLRRPNLYLFNNNLRHWICRRIRALRRPLHGGGWCGLSSASGGCSGTSRTSATSCRTSPRLCARL